MLHPHRHVSSSVVAFGHSDSQRWCIVAVLFCYACGGEAPGVPSHHIDDCLARLTETFPHVGSSPLLIGDSVVLVPVGCATLDVERLRTTVRSVERLSAIVAGHPHHDAPLVGLGVFPSADAYQGWVGRFGTDACFLRSTGCAAVAAGDNLDAAVAHEISHGMQWRCKWPDSDPVWVVWWEEGWAEYAEGFVGDVSTSPSAIRVLCDWVATRGGLLKSETIVRIDGEKRMFEAVNAPWDHDDVKVVPECGTIVCAHSWLIFAFLMEHSAATKDGVRALGARYRTRGGARSLLDPDDVAQLTGQHDWSALDEALQRFLEQKKAAALAAER